MNKNILAILLSLLVLVPLFSADENQAEQILTNNNSRDLSWSQILAFNPWYFSGTTADIDFDLLYSSSDGEWVGGVSLTFPVGVTVNSATDIDILQYNSEAGNGITVTWGEINALAFDSIFYDESFSVNVTIPAGFTGDMYLDWAIYGDGWSVEYSIASGSLILEQSLVVAPMLVSPTNEDTLVSINTTLDWTNDAYTDYAVLSIADNVDFTNETVVIGAVSPYAVSLDYNTTYYWKVRAYGPDGDHALSEVRSFTTTNVYVDDNPEVIIGTPILVQLVAVLDGNVPGSWTANGPVPIPAPTPLTPLNNPLPANAGAYLFGASISQSVPGIFTYTFIVPGGSYTGVAYLDGEVYFAGTWLGGVVTIDIPFSGAKDGHEVVLTEPTLPVELSSFTAVANANEYVSLKWVAESESNLHGYNVYRSETESFNQASRINPIIVGANNQAVTSTYSYTDTEVETATYHYWLEVSELNNENSFHGPIVVRVEDNAVVPGVSETTFSNFGPSPFTQSTSTSLRVKEGEKASVTIYNLLGQVVRRESFNAGEHNFTFNGRDINNKKVANGIYFVRMTSPTASKSFKIVKIK